MGKKLNLPLFADSEAKKATSRDAPKKPSIDAARARLGGRILGDASPLPPGLAPGVVVTFPLSSGRRMPGVVVFASQAEVHVLLDGVRLRRLPPDQLAVHEGEVAVDLGKLAGDARLFGLIVEGQPVRYADDDGNLVDGKVVEKCRWGALVRRDDGAVVAVGFRKLWPAPAGASA